jgi:hypothetical protein
MADDVKITVTAVDNASTTIGGIQGALLSFNMVMAAAREVQQGVKQAFDATVGTLLTYADSVKTLSNITNTSSESVSRLITVTDRYGVGVSNLEAASRKLATQGLSLTLDTVAKLSDEFLKLNTGAERQAFMTENLGRASTKWAEILTQGSAAILANGAAVQDSLILTQAQIDQTHDYEMRLVDLDQQWQAMKLNAGELTLPIVMKVVTAAAQGMELPAMVSKLNEEWLRSSTSAEEYNKHLDDTFTSSERLYLVLFDGIGYMSAAEFQTARNSMGLEHLTNVTSQAAAAAGEYRKSVEFTADEIKAYVAVVDEGISITDRMNTSDDKRAQITQQISNLLPGQTAKLKSLQDQLNSLNAADVKQHQSDLWGAVKEGLSGVNADSLYGVAEGLGLISPAAAKAMAQMQLIKNVLASLPKITDLKIMISIIESLTYTGDEASQARYANTVVGGGVSGGGSSTAYWIPDPNNPGHYMVNPNHKAGGGSFSGWAMVGDSPGGGTTPYTEYVYAPQGATVFNQAQMSGQSAPPMAGGGMIPPMSSGVDLSDDSLRKLADLIVYSAAQRQ